MEYNENYSGDLFSETTTEEFQKAEKDKYTLEMDDGFRMPPLMLAFRFVGHPTNPRLQEEVAKACIIGKKVVVKKNGEAIGSVVINSTSDSFDAFPVLQEHPKAFSHLMNSAHAFVLKKFSPSIKNTQTVVSAAKGISS
jgi:hypothetical protein